MLLPREAGFGRQPCCRAIHCDVTHSALERCPDKAFHFQTVSAKSCRLTWAWALTLYLKRVLAGLPQCLNQSYGLYPARHVIPPKNLLSQSYSISEPQPTLWTSEHIFKGIHPHTDTHTLTRYFSVTVLFWIQWLIVSHVFHFVFLTQQEKEIRIFSFLKMPLAVIDILTSSARIILGPLFQNWKLHSLSSTSRNSNTCFVK